MNPRRIVLGAAAAALLAGGVFASPVGAGVAAPADMIVTPNTAPVGTTVVISNADNSLCGGQEGDGQTVVELSVIRPDSDDVEITIPVDESGNWSIGYINTDLVGVYTVEGTCSDDTKPSDAQPNVSNFDYTDATFTITAAETPSTEAPPTTVKADPAPAVDATAAFTG